MSDERVDEIGKLGEEERRDMINAAPNCKQVDLRDAYRKPQKPGPGDHA